MNIGLDQFQSWRPLRIFRGYKDAQMFQYDVGEESLQARWLISANVTHGCRAAPVRYYLRWRSFPIVKNDNASWPTGFAPLFYARERSTGDEIDPHQHVIDLYSDSQIAEFNITNPLPGRWYGLAFINVLDVTIAQRGLFRECEVWLTSSLSTTPFSSRIRRPYRPMPSSPVFSQPGFYGPPTYTVSGPGTMGE